MAKIRRTLFIGLGGTGMQALVKTKKMLYDNYGEIPPMVGFLGLDTDGGVYSKTELAADGTPIGLTAAEQLPMTVSNPRAVYKRAPMAYDWLPPCNVSSLDTLSIGAGATRSNGRFAITMHEKEIENRIAAAMNAINAARNINNSRYSLLSNSTEIHVVFSLGGGTGCGTFLNLAYLLRRMYPLDCKISGYALMSDVFRALVAGAGSSRVRSNAYGAILDLDYIISEHLSGKNPISIKWQKSEQTATDEPFDAIYFIDNKNEANYTFVDSSPLCDMISLALVTGLGELSVATASVSDNVARDISQGLMDVAVPVNPNLPGSELSVKHAWVAGFGVSEITFNSRALNRIYVDKAILQIIDRLRNGGCDDPSTIANSWIDENHIRENLKKDDVIDYFMAPQPPTMLEYIEPAHAAGDAEAFFNRYRTESDQAMTEKLDALKNRVELSLANLIDQYVNRECGVYNAEHIIKVLIAQANLCDGEMETEIAELEDELVRTTSECENLVREISETTGTFQASRRKALCADLCECTTTRTVKSREIQRRQLARSFYTWLLNLLRGRLSRVDSILESLGNVYANARNEIEATRQNLAKSTFFSEDLTAFEVDKVECAPSDIVMQDFIIHMRQFGGISAFVSTTSAQISEWIRTFAESIPKARDYRNLTLESILSKLDKETLAEICRKAITKALPLLPYNYKGYETYVAVPPTDYYYIGVADRRNCVLEKNDFLKNLIPGNINPQFTSTGLNDRVIIYHQISVIPAFALEAIENYETEYNRREQTHRGGAHWDFQLYERMRNERASLWPASVSGDNELQAWVEAIAYGLLSFDEQRGQYMLKSIALGGRPLTGFRVPVGATRVQAFNTFRDSLERIRPEIDSEIQRKSAPEAQELAEKIKQSAADCTYLSDFSMCPLSIEALEKQPGDYDLIDREMMFIISNL